MTFELKKAQRRQVKLRIGIFGASGSGKTWSALKLAHGLLGNWEKIAVIDTETQSADLYSDLGDYNTMALDAPYTPERYIAAIDACQKAGMEVIIIDSITHEWSGIGGMLEIVDLESDKNAFTKWRRPTIRHNLFISKILLCPTHIICCGRSKDEISLEENDKGKKVPVKHGTKVITRDGFDYEMTVCFDLDKDHYAHCTKDRSGIFKDKPLFQISEETGKELIAWSNEGEEPVITDNVVPIQTKELCLKIGSWVNAGLLKAEEILKYTDGKSIKELVSIGDIQTIINAMPDIEILVAGRWEPKEEGGLFYSIP